MKSHLAASSAEEWNVQELSVACIPCRDGESSDEHRCQILRSTSRHALKNQNNKTKIKLWSGGGGGEYAGENGISQYAIVEEKRETSWE